MVILLGHVLFTGLLLIGAIRAVVARDRRGLLWGSTLTTMGLVGTLWLSGIGALTSLLAIIFLIFDFCLFTFSGSIRLLPKGASSEHRTNIYPALVIWLALAFLVASLLLIWIPHWPLTPAPESNPDRMLADVLKEFWEHRTFSLYLIVGLIFGVSIGSFFMIERERQS